MHLAAVASSYSNSCGLDCTDRCITVIRRDRLVIRWVQRVIRVVMNGLRIVIMGSRLVSNFLMMATKVGYQNDSHQNGQDW